MMYKYLVRPSHLVHEQGGAFESSSLYITIPSSPIRIFDKKASLRCMLNLEQQCLVGNILYLQQILPYISDCISDPKPKLDGLNNHRFTVTLKCCKKLGVIQNHVSLPKLHYRRHQSPFSCMI